MAIFNTAIQQISPGQLEKDFRGYWWSIVQKSLPLDAAAELCAAGCSFGFDFNKRPRPELFAAFLLIGLTMHCPDVDAAWAIAARAMGYKLAGITKKCPNCGKGGLENGNCPDCGGPYPLLPPPLTIK